MVNNVLVKNQTIFKIRSDYNRWSEKSELLIQQYFYNSLSSNSLNGEKGAKCEASKTFYFFETIIRPRPPLRPLSHYEALRKITACKAGLGADGSELIRYSNKSRGFFPKNRSAAVV